MSIQRQNVILIATCLAITTALPQQNIKYSNNLQINENDKFNINKINKESNDNPIKSITDILTNSRSELDKETWKSSHISDISKTSETDLSVLNIPHNSKQNNLNILSAATKSKGDDNKTLKNNVTIPKASEFSFKFNEPDLSVIKKSFNSVKNDLDIINTAIKSLNNYTNNTHNETKINVGSDFQEHTDNSHDASLNTFLKLDTSTEISTILPDTTNTPATTTTTIITTTPSTTVSTSTTTEISNESPDYSISNEELLSEITQLSSNDLEKSKVGQKITIQLSAVNSDTEEKTNSAGAEILKNISTVCGSLLGKRISFANETTLMEFPWTALLLYNTNLRYHCGGSLITNKYVLTAAHCVAQEFYELTGVRLGEHDITENPDCAPDIVGTNICATTVDADVIKIIIHHGFSHSSFKNDIALLQLDKEYGDRSFYPICLLKPDEEYIETQATVAGWGATQNALRSAVLLKAEVPILDMSRCREIYRYSVFNDSTEICGSGVNEVDVCKGDSGGAIFLRRTVDKKQKYYQLGIISLGVRRCGDSRFLPAVFTKVKGFYKWIENNIES